MEEWEQIAKFQKAIGLDRRVLLGIGDDTALVECPDQMLVTVDMLVEGVHFDLNSCTAEDVGQKAMNVNLSDIAAMAGTPLFAVVAVALPPNRPAEIADQLFAGLHEAAKCFGTTIIGGDTNRSSGPLSVSVTLLGTPTGRGPLTRSGAQPDDCLLVTGSLGYSLVDGKHLHFRPRIEEARTLHQNYRLTSMIDLSDGLGSDLFHLTERSCCGAELDADAIPVRTLNIAATDKRSALDHALNDGEDFELLFTASFEEAQRILHDRPLERFSCPISVIGRMTQTPGIRIREAGNLRDLPRGGFQHRW